MIAMTVKERVARARLLLSASAAALASTMDGGSIGITSEEIREATVALLVEAHEQLYWIQCLGEHDDAEALKALNVPAPTDDEREAEEARA